VRPRSSRTHRVGIWLRANVRSGVRVDANIVDVADPTAARLVPVDGRPRHREAFSSTLVEQEPPVEKIAGPKEAYTEDRRG
jgi:hypothetical protein